jgi:hypothetical protein
LTGVLRQLIINSYVYTFEDFQMFVKQTPNLKSSTLFDNVKIDMIDACRWKDLITSLITS